MANRFAVAVAILLCAIPALAAESAEAVAAPPPGPPDWSVIIGAGALAMPAYPGSASTRVLPLPYIDVRYRDLLFISPVAGLGVNVVRGERLRLGAAVLPDFGRSDSSSDRLRGWGSVGAGANVRVFGIYSLGVLDVLADVRRQIGAGNGILADAGVTRTFVVSRRLIVIPTATLTWADARYMQTYFGVGEGASVAPYSIGAGLRDVSLMLLAIVPLDDRWSVQSLVRAEVLLGDAAHSPVTEQRLQPMFGGFLSYRL